MDRPKMDCLLWRLGAELVVAWAGLLGAVPLAAGLPAGEPLPVPVLVPLPPDPEGGADPAPVPVPDDCPGVMLSGALAARAMNSDMVLLPVVALCCVSAEHGTNGKACGAKRTR